jgi:CheY-like chemotaxis protein
MPDMEGSEVASKLNEDKDTKDIPIVILTAIIKEAEAKESGGFISGYHFVAKPVNTDKLINVIEQAIINE